MTLSPRQKTDSPTQPTSINDTPAHCRGRNSPRPHGLAGRTSEQSNASDPEMDRYLCHSVGTPQVQADAPSAQSGTIATARASTNRDATRARPTRQAWPARYPALSATSGPSGPHCRATQRGGRQTHHQPQRSHGSPVNSPGTLGESHAPEWVVDPILAPLRTVQALSRRLRRRHSHSDIPARKDKTCGT
jgi:hypothetical protein